ncbi:MAG: hypothetical protein REI78_07230 [Pedobacter sp.]|nr:hypothetical protein [Pedobacter sp.]MDQ8052801.1 hypothetical protein [Pedobacter sp.]
MFNLNFFKQKSPQQRFLFILGVVMMIVYLGIGILVIFFSDRLHIDPDKFPASYRIAFGVLLIIYAIIRFSRLLNKKEIV